MDLVSLLIAVLVIGLIFYALSYLPIPEPFKTIGYVVAIVAVIIYVLRFLP